MTLIYIPLALGLLYIFAPTFKPMLFDEIDSVDNWYRREK